MKMLLADGMLVNIPKPKQGEDECNNHNNATCNLPNREKKLFYPHGCLTNLKSAINMIWFK